MPHSDYMNLAAKAMPQIQKGAFLTVRSGERLNTMTIGWAAVGYCWRKPVFMVMVRESRHTFGIIEAAADFTVSVPRPAMQEAVTFCGTRSGREVDKFEACRLETAETGRSVSPVIDTPGIHFVCRIVQATPMDPGRLAADLEPLYPQKDYHTLYFGEIIDCYEK